MKMAKEREIERWITVNGARVPIFKGQSVKEAVSNFITKSTKKGPNQKKDNYRTPEQLQGLKEDAEEYARTGKTHDWSKEYISEVKDYLKKNPVRKESKFDEMMKWKTPEQVQALKEDAEDYAKTGKTHDWSPEYVNEVKAYLNHQKQASKQNDQTEMRKKLEHQQAANRANEQFIDSQASKLKESGYFYMFNDEIQGNGVEFTKLLDKKGLKVLENDQQGNFKIGRANKNQTETQKQISKDLDEKERQIAQNKTEADRASGKNEHYDTVLNDIRGKLDRGELTPEQARNKAFEYEKGQRGNKQWNDVDKNKMQSKVRDIFDGANKREQEARQSSGKQTDWIEEHNRRAAEIMAKENAQRIKTYNERVSNLKPKEGFKTKTSGFDIQGSSHETMVDGIKFTHFSDFKDRATYAAPTNTVKKENGRIISGDFVRIHGSGYISDDLKVRKAIANAYGFTNFGKNKKG